LRFYYTSPILLAALFYLGAALSLLPFSKNKFAQELKYIKKSPKDVKRIIGAVVFGGILGPICLLYGVKLTTASTASLLLNLETVATTFLAFIIFKEHVGKRVVLASILTILAGALLIINFDYNINIGGLLVALGCFFWGFDNNFTATVEGISPQTNTIIKGLVAGLFNLFLALALGHYQIDLWTFIFAILVGFVSYGFSISLYILSARQLGASRSQIIFASNPFIGSLLSFLIFWNLPGTKFLIALGIMILAVILLYYEKHAHMHCHPELEHEHEHTHDDDHHFHSHKGSTDRQKHTHKHIHKKQDHSHLHYPDLHHRHSHWGDAPRTRGDFQ